MVINAAVEIVRRRQVFFGFGSGVELQRSESLQRHISWPAASVQPSENSPPLSEHPLTIRKLDYRIFIDYQKIKLPLYVCLPDHFTAAFYFLTAPIFGIFLALFFYSDKPGMLREALTAKL